MLIAYTSRTGNVRKFVERTGFPSIRLEEDTVVNEPFVLVTYTSGFGQIPKNVVPFLTLNHQYLRGVSSSGNRNWGEKFGKAADSVSLLFGVPIINKFEHYGSEKDVAHFIEEVHEIEAHRA
ncbi:class Ib ribonucleoside-diphosphate reductase assembly flavoprotein NrdI [Paenibacillus xylanexedens]|uniref:class Ib ribonucleoside-diphosphate reductase assembly flavoprotein NrdI n=1 Tax=Paenibacillus xylanexedens TaxID=528191 RepID=UPI0011A03E43|nr:class Ib ribonucleoside-diphosphate reductase assembly flavoprotein NrdI [Paenibacillus xylanexedens]